MYIYILQIHFFFITFCIKIYLIQLFCSTFFRFDHKLFILNTIYGYMYNYLIIFFKFKIVKYITSMYPYTYFHIPHRIQNLYVFYDALK